MAVATKCTDAQTARIYAALKSAFPDLPTEESDVVYKRNRYTIRVRVISRIFEDKSLTERHTLVKKVLAPLAIEDREDIAVVLMLTPEDALDPDLMNGQFDESYVGSI